ncbi:SH3 domain-binding glutamic acid-rich-like protein 3 isoform X2 [Bufo gargarizans]|uniref:SH3 domain-binding glutamic acid-rich-like protein 3 isoform X2 n=1 Tax=Bufo gargarizans TaxID=30331 RepID=UPI001CF0FD09|nr:SH3 domain-binding glutamic acid-rich-like protein 3 isoform X2 [Bufo gargarizans]
MAGNLTFFMSSVTSTREMKSQQNEMKRILDSHGIPYDSVDISVDKCLLDKMREQIGNPRAVPPQLFRGEKCIGF